MNRSSAVSGTFYPADPQDLQIVVEDYLAEAKDVGLPKVKGIIAPHAGLIYSGGVAAFGYKQLKDLSETNLNVFLLGPAHHVFVNASVGNYEKYQTPLGEVKVNQKICEELLTNSMFEFTPTAHEKEHSLEVQIPFLQKVLSKFQIIPILVGKIDSQQLGKALEAYFQKDDSLFVFSSDLSHFFPYAHAQVVDQKTIDSILAMSSEEDFDACGNVPIQTAIYLASKFGYRIQLLC